MSSIHSKDGNKGGYQELLFAFDVSCRQVPEVALMNRTDAEQQTACEWKYDVAFQHKDYC